MNNNNEYESLIHELRENVRDLRTLIKKTIDSNLFNDKLVEEEFKCALILTLPQIRPIGGKLL